MNDDALTAIKALEQMPTAPLSVDLSEWRPDEDPEGFIESCMGMVTFGCSVTIEGTLVTIEGPAPVIAILEERIAETLLGATGAS